MTNLRDKAAALGIELKENESMSAHTTFRIGGPAKLVFYPKTPREAAEVVRLCHACGESLVTVGRGSNLLVGDHGISGPVMLFAGNMAEIRLVDETTIYAQSGAKLSDLCRFAQQNALSGLEFAYGIPGSCGGAAFMNAGAYGGEMCDVLVRCDHIAPDGTPGFLEGDALALSYRKSAYSQNGCVITGIYCRLQKGDPAAIRAKMDELMDRRRTKQPLEYPSAGSTFKRPQGNYASALIEQCGLKGLSVGGAQVSEKHAGFVINRTGSASCADVLALCRKVQQTVLEKTGYRLELEVRTVGE